MIVISVIGLIVSIIATALIIPQLVLLNKQIKDSHEEHRRENTTQIMHIWCSSMKKETSMAEEIVRNLNEAQCNSLYRHDPFTVSEDIKDCVCKFCPLSESECASCSLKTSCRVDGKIHNELRYHVICYLNMLETVMTSWELGIVDRETIKEQFKFLTVASEGMALDALRRVIHGGYPLIEKFIDSIKDKAPKPKNIM